MPCFVFLCRGFSAKVCPCMSCRLLMAGPSWAPSVARCSGAIATIEAIRKRREHCIAPGYTQSPRPSWAHAFAMRNCCSGASIRVISLIPVQVHIPTDAMLRTHCQFSPGETPVTAQAIIRPSVLYALHEAVSLRRAWVHVTIVRAFLLTVTCKSAHKKLVQSSHSMSK